MYHNDLACGPIARAIDFVEGHLQEEISVSDMADVAGYSLFHFCRLFNQTTHHTPYDYLMRRRIAEAARQLKQTDRKIVDIAFTYRFNSHETFSRAFKRVVDVPPIEVRKRGQTPPWRLLPRLTRDHLEHLHKGAYLEPALVEEDAIELTGLMTTVRREPEDASWLRDQLHEELDRHGDHAETRDEHAIAYYPDGWEDDGYLFMMGVDAPPMKDPPFPLVSQSLPALQYARFVHKGARRDLHLTLEYVFHAWLPRSGSWLAGPWVRERYSRRYCGFDDPQSEWAIYVPIIMAG
jgi:AraC family transcriptional regulator